MVSKKIAQRSRHRNGAAPFVDIRSAKVPCSFRAAKAMILLSPAHLTHCTSVIGEAAQNLLDGSVRSSNRIGRGIEN
jgi:hypothetical protein